MKNLEPTSQIPATKMLLLNSGAVQTAPAANKYVETVIKPNLPSPPQQAVPIPSANTTPGVPATTTTPAPSKSGSKMWLWVLGGLAAATVGVALYTNSDKPTKKGLSGTQHKKAVKRKTTKKAVRKAIKHKVVNI